MNLREALGAKSAATTHKISLYLPDKDCDGKPVEDIEAWIDLAIDLLTKINGGATCPPPCYGTWKTKNRKVVRENTRIIYSYITNPARFERNINTVRTFLHSFGRACRQEEVIVEFSGEDKATFVQRAYFIDAYPSAQALKELR
ncbi:hypothetical protein [Sphingomonas sp.]|uniref:hypothetical protein n=1 Tax=Sphingomonas sp. TaxID=28214 RepID=UPI003F72AB7B